MKNLKYKLIPVLFATMALGSCKKDFLETTPTQQADDATVFATTANAMAALNGIHRSMYLRYDAQDQGGQGSMNINIDMLGDDLVNTAAGNGWYNSTYRWTAHRSAASTTDKFAYKFYYQIIANANNIIEKIGGAEGPEADKNLIKAEALTYRAWAHFMVVQLYAKRYDFAGSNTQPGVPVKTKLDTEHVGRGTVEQVYTQANADIDEAITLFATASASPNKSHFNIKSAKGIKARIALTQGKWTEAAKFAAEARTGVELMSNVDYLAGFNSYTNPEWIWGSKQVEDQTSYFYSFFAYMSANYNSSNLRANPKAINSNLYNKLSKTDIRAQLWDPTGENKAFPIPTSTSVRAKYMNRKFLVAGVTSVGDVVNMRAAEMYLIEAEGLARAGQYGAAQDALYTLAKKRDDAYVKSTKTGNDLIEEIMVQRRVELWGEGFRFTDLKRLNLPLDRTNSNHTVALAQTLSEPAGDARWQWLIPQSEIDANKAIEPGDQNP